ncbi:uncharacterized protein LOC105232960 [Bactrocera dorsalis]|uniref:Uncharacterized protein LOC105232960 n=2 Tax=Bactrocera dorsalis TaxID=27457 RepID=A0A8N4LAS4_BACDO|nr:uncharacterized protein LOC105232960 [Bactrocera dorsalis]XP_049304182.1 uncharacterized protein LOC105232960 [Bactrocera dorsalis]XP_049304183.1 uncharacterized protein LOC105232960 [Bactrocera dorsalis]
MFWLCSVSLSLFDYRLIVINTLIYDLIATEIANANAHIVIAANVMTEFDKSAAIAATTPETRTIPPTGAEQQRVAHEMSIKGKATTIKIPTTISSNNTADVAFLGQKLSDCSDDDEISTNNSNNKSKVSRAANGVSNNIALQVALPASANVPFVSTAAARPLAMSAHNGMYANNKATVMRSINERVDNFRNDKKETNVWIITTTTAAVKVDRSMAAPIGTTKTTTSATSNAATLAISKRPAIKSTAMHLTTSALATASVMTVKTTVQATTTTNAQAAKSAIEQAATAAAHETRSKWATALATTTTLSTPTTTGRIIHATAAWPTLRSHDLLSSTNGMPNCRNATCVCVRTEKSQDATNINTATAATMTTTPLAPTTRVPITTAMASATTLLRTSTTVANTTLQTTKAAATVRRATATTANKGGAFAGYVAGAAGSTTGGVAATPMRSLIPCSTYSSPATPAAPTMSTTTTTAIHTANITDSAAGKSTAGPLQTQWQRILSRRKRYLAFPEGTSFTTSVCITVGIIGNPYYSYMSFGLNFGMGYDLPNATWVLNQLHGLSRRPVPMAVHHRRSKRAIYERIAEAVNNMGYSGRDCVLRALCESRQYFTRSKMGMIGEILRVIFSLPKQRLFSRELREDADIAAYDHAYRKAHSQVCVAQYDCPFSLLELAFGRYSTPSIDFYGESGM